MPPAAGPFELMLIYRSCDLIGRRPYVILTFIALAQGRQATYSSQSAAPHALRDNQKVNKTQRRELCRKYLKMEDGILEVKAINKFIIWSKYM